MASRPNKLSASREQFRVEGLELLQSNPFIVPVGVPIVPSCSLFFGGPVGLTEAPEWENPEYSAVSTNPTHQVGLLMDRVLNDPIALNSSTYGATVY